MTEAEREYEIGGEHDSNGRADEAIPHYRRALELGLPDELEPRALLQLASSLRNVGRNADAIAVFDDAVAGFPGDAALRLFRAFALATEGRDREALVDVLDLARTRIDAPEVRRYARSLENYTRDLAPRAARLRDRYPEIEPYEDGLLDVGDGNVVYWEASGNPDGKPALVVHGGPGSGSSPRTRRLFDPARYRIVQFDQRGCGRSTPHAGTPGADLSVNTTQHLLADIELLREHLAVERWLVLGASWGSTLALAYAVTRPDRVSELILWGVTTGRHSEWDWLFRGRGMRPLLPEAWEELVAALPGDARDGDVVAAYSKLLEDPDPGIRDRAALAWCTWESATPDWPPKPGLDERFEDPRYRLAFARLVTHYARHYGFLVDGELLRRAHVLAETPGTLVHGRFDLGSPLGNAWELKRAWPRSELVVVDDAGHSATAGSVSALVAATDAFAAIR